MMTVISWGLGQPLTDSYLFISIDFVLYNETKVGDGDGHRYECTQWPLNYTLKIGEDVLSLPSLPQ